MKTTFAQAFVSVDGKIFRDFAVFDCLMLPRRIIKMAGFAALMIFFAIIDLIGGSLLLFWVLLLIGLLVPVTYVYNFSRSVTAQIKRLGLQKPKRVYTIEISKSGIDITDAEQQKSSAAWGDIHGIYRVNGCMYIYFEKRRAYIMPESQITGATADKVWELFAGNIGEKASDRRAKKS